MNKKLSNSYDSLLRSEQCAFALPDISVVRVNFCVAPELYANVLMR